MLFLGFWNNGKSTLKKIVFQIFQVPKYSLNQLETNTAVSMETIFVAFFMLPNKANFV